MTPAKEAWAIGKLAAVMEEIFAETDGGPEGYAKLLDLFGKAIMSIADSPQQAIAGLIQTLDEPDAIEAAKRLGYRKDRS